MADEYAKLLAQQQGIGYSPRENIYGQIGGTIASALPQLVRPYASSSSNIATVLGGSLLAGLLGYQARKEAAEQNEILLPKITGIMGAKTIDELDAQAKTLDADQLERVAPVLVQQMALAQEREAEQQAAKQKLAQDLLVEAVKTGQLPGSALNIPELEEIRFPTVDELARQKAIAETQAEYAATLTPEGQALAQQKLDEKKQEMQAKIDAAERTIPAATKEKLAKKAGFLELAETINRQIENYQNSAAFLFEEKFSFSGEGLKERFKNLADKELRDRTGAAARPDETKAIEKMIRGDATAYDVQVVQNILKTYIMDEANIAATTIEAIKGGPSKLKNRFEDIAARNIPKTTTPTIATTIALPQREDFPDLESYKKALQDYTGQ